MKSKKALTGQEVAKLLLWLALLGLGFFIIKGLFSTIFGTS